MVNWRMSHSLVQCLADEVARPCSRPAARSQPRKRVASPVRRHALAGQQRHADGAHDAVVRRHDDLLAEDLAEGGRDGVVVGRAALEEDAVADLALAHQAVEVVVGDGVGQAGDEVLARARRAAGSVMTSRSMNTVQRSPRRIGAVDCSARSANSPMMLMPSFSACSSRNEPVPAAQASFMAKSTTMPSCRLMNLESWPPISKMVSTCRAMRAADEVGAGLVGGDLVGDDVGADELADELAARAGGAHAQHADAVADLVADLGQAGVDDLDRARLRSWCRSP